MPRRKPPQFSDPPSADQLREALDIAQSILADPDDDWYPASYFKLVDEFEQLGLATTEQQREALARAAAEVCPEDYVPPEPPGIADQESCRGTRMLPFGWQSESFGCQMFFKFGIQKHGYLYVFSLHELHFPLKNRSAR
jgi:hypothetical protein